MLKLIHGADFHLDSPFSGLSPEKAAQRRQEQRQMLSDLAWLVQYQKADLLLLSGDLFDSNEIYRETAEALSTALGSMTCPVFIAPGNHDCYNSRSPYNTIQWPENVHIFPSDRIEGVELTGLNCTVWGRAFTDPHQTAAPLKGFCAPHQDGNTHVMVLHGDLAAASDYGPVTEEDIAASALDYLALGHVHQCSGLKKAGNTYYAYPGCPAGRGFDETGDKGVLYVELDNGSAKAALVPLCRRRYHILQVDVTGADPKEAVEAALPEHTEDDIYRVILTGECSGVNLKALEAALADHFYGLSLKDQTRLPRGLWDRRGENNLTGLFLSLMWEKCQAEPDNVTLQQAARFGLAALEKGEDPYL